MAHFGDHDGKSKTSSAVDAAHYPEASGDAHSSGLPALSAKEIATLAYHLWEKRGRPSDSAESDWLEAEQQLMKAQGIPAQTRILVAQAGSVQR